MSRALFPIRGFAVRAGLLARGSALVLGAAMLCGMAPIDRSPAPGSTPARPSIASYFRTEVRLRKLHLVRPDLIQYPLEYEVYC